LQDSKPELELKAEGWDPADFSFDITLVKNKMGFESKY
jgi:hypothetical protein